MNRMEEPMVTISPSEVERVVSALPNRRVLDFPRRIIQPHSAEFLANERKLAETIRASLKKSGIEVEKIEKTLADNQKEQRAIVEKEQTEAYKRLPQMDTLRHGIDARFKAFEFLTSTNVIKATTFVVLDTPFLIWAQPSNVLTASHIEPRNSTANIRHEVDSDSLDDTPGNSEIVSVGFYFQWENSSLNPAVLLNVSSHLAVKGLWECSASAGLIFPDDAGVEAEVNLHLYEWWNQPPTMLTAPREIIFDMEVDGGFALGGPGTNAFTWVFNGYDVKFTSLVVPPKGVVVFEVTLDTWIGFCGDPCTADIKIDGSDSSVLCPFVQFEVREAISKGPPLP
jgi:hypothetical protein